MCNTSHLDVFVRVGHKEQSEEQQGGDISLPPTSSHTAFAILFGHTCMLTVLFFIKTDMRFIVEALILKLTHQQTTKVHYQQFKCYFQFF